MYVLYVILAYLTIFSDLVIKEALSSEVGLNLLVKQSHRSASLKQSYMHHYHAQGYASWCVYEIMHCLKTANKVTE